MFSASQSISSARAFTRPAHASKRVSSVRGPVKVRPSARRSRARDGEARADGERAARLSTRRLALNVTDDERARRR